MKKNKLLELLKYIKVNDLIQKYNDVYKKYDDKNETKNSGFRLQDLYSLTDKEVDLIISSKHDVEALFRLRMNSVGYKKLIKNEINLNDNVVLETIEKFRRMEDYDEYDREKIIIEIIIKQNKSGINNILLFLSNMVNKKQLIDTELTIDNLVYYLCSIDKCKTYESANLLSLLASSLKERTNCGLNKYIDENYILKVIDKISECDKSFQANGIHALLRMKDNNPSHNAILLNNIGNDITKKIKVIDLFTKIENVHASIIMLEILRENTEDLRNRPDYIINMLEECSTLKNDEDYVSITTITEIEDLERALVNIDKDLEINGSVKIKVKKQK